MPITNHKDWAFEDPLVVVGFPSHGLVGAIVASYVVPKLNMELVATMDSPHFPPTASIRDGRALAPVQFYASRQQCGLNGECSQLVVVRSDVAPPPQHTDRVAGELLEWCQGIGAELVVMLEGAGAEDAPDEVFGCQNLVAQIDLDAVKVSKFPQGSISGMSGAVLKQGNARGLGVVCLFTPVHPDLPDAGGAARLVDVTDLLVPGIKMDAKPLEEEAAELEKQLRKSIQEQRRAMGSEDPSAMMYG